MTPRYQANPLQMRNKSTVPVAQKGTALAATRKQEAGIVNAQPFQYTTEALSKGAREIVITHAGATYRLRITHANKLILTK